MLELKGITKRYKKDKKNKKDKIALNNVNLSFKDSGLYFITGKSGSGKSTLLNILSGIDNKFDGDLFVDGKSMKAFNRNDLNYYRGSYVGYVFQNYNLIPSLNAYDNVKLGADISGLDDDSKIHEVFLRLGLEELEEREINELSGGEAQRVAIARCLIKNPKVIICDEPTGALDKENGKMVMDTLYQISKEALVIVVTHDDSFVSMYESINYQIIDGKVESEINAYEVSKVFHSDKYKGVSWKLKFKIGFEILFQKKLSLLFSLIFIILATICLSVSISGARYNVKDVVYNQMITDDTYIVERFSGHGGQYGSDYKCTEEYLDGIKDVSDEIIYGYTLKALGCDTLLLAFYKKEANLATFNSSFGNVFNYNEAKEYFGLEVVSGSAPTENDEIVITDVMVERFFEYGYKVNGIEKDIESNEDMIGLKILDFKITGIVSCKKSSEYRRDILKYKKATSNIYGEMIDDDVYNGCLNSMFFAKELYSCASDGTTNVDAIFTKKTDTKIYKNYIFNLLDNDLDENSTDFYCLGNAVIVSYVDSSKYISRTARIIGFIGLAFLAISIFLIYRHINVSISYKEKDLGVLKSIGVSNKDIFEILNIQNVFITVINILFVSVFQYAFIYKLNSIVLEQYIIPFKVDSFTITIFNYVSIIILSIVVPFVASLYSIIVCSKKSPKDILNND